MKVKLIYNPVSGYGAFKNHFDYIIDKFQKKGMQIEPYRTSTEKALEKVLASMNQQEYKKILVAGGDGTINQVINYIIKYEINLPLGIFPMGTANDYAQNFNLPSSIEEIVEILLRNNYTYSDVGLINNKYFINVASMGSIIDVSQKTKTESKNSLGILSYYLNGVGEIAKLKSSNVKIESIEKKFEGDALFVLIMNGKSAGGFNKIAPSASVNDGFLDVFIFKKCQGHEVIPLLIDIVGGEHINNINVVHFRTKELTINANENIATDIDGEVGPTFPLNIKVIPKKIKVITRFNNEEGIIPPKTYDLEELKKTIKQISAAILKGKADNSIILKDILGKIENLNDNKK